MVLLNEGEKNFHVEKNTLLSLDCPNNLTMSCMNIIYAGAQTVNLWSWWHNDARSLGTQDIFENNYLKFQSWEPKILKESKMSLLSFKNCKLIFKNISKKIKKKKTWVNPANCSVHVMNDLAKIELFHFLPSANGH